MKLSRISFAVSMFAAIMLTGCSEAEAPKAAAPPAEKGIFISSSDCAGNGKLTEEACGKAIDMAVAAHNEQAPVHKTLRSCEAAEGPDRCNKTGENEYRPRLQAFFVTMSESATAEPLYPPAKSAVGFQSLAKTAIDARDEALHVSVEATTVANENGRLAARDSQ